MEKALIIFMSLLTVVMISVLGFSLLTLEFRYVEGNEVYPLPLVAPGELLIGATALLIIAAVALAFYKILKSTDMPGYLMIFSGKRG